MRRHGRRGTGGAFRRFERASAVRLVLHAAATVMRLAEAPCHPSPGGAICTAARPCLACKAKALRNHARSLAGRASAPAPRPGA